MDDRLIRLEATAEQLGLAVRCLEQRVNLLEAQRRGEPASSSAALAGDPRSTVGSSAAVSVSPARDPRDPIFILSLLGRLFLVLAGGFFLRAMTEAGVLAPPVGIALAFGYGLSWLFLADRASQRGQPTSAVFHAVGSAMVVFPLLVEATTRFKVLSGASSAVGIILLTAGLLLVAWRRCMPGVAWVTAIAALPTSAVLLLKSGLVMPFAFHVIGLGVATLWLGYSLGWTAIRWPTAVAADLIVVGVTLRALMPEQPDALGVALVLQWSLLGAYVASISIQSLVRGRAVGWFEIAQTCAALVISFGGTVLLARATETLPAATGLACVIAGAACYGAVFVVVDRRKDPAYNVHYYTTLALLLVLVGTSFLLDEPWPGVVFALLGVLAAGLWARVGRPYLLLHAAAYVVAAGFVSGALVYGARALASGAAGTWVPPGAEFFVVLVAAGLCAGLAALRPGPGHGAFANGSRLVLAMVCVWIAVGGVTGWLAPTLAGGTDPGVDLGKLATVRTGVLAAATLLVAWIGRHARFREWAWLVYPLLVLIGLKMVAQDFGQSRPATLFIALALFGAALIVAPRLRRRGDRVVRGTA